MIVFVGGSRNLSRLSDKVTQKLDSICEKGFEIIIGDAFGADAMVQSYLHAKGYRNVTIYSVTAEPRNNKGNWRVQKIIVPRSSKRGFDFYAAKDAEMAKVCDCGFMLSSGWSRGTNNNGRMLTSLDKTVVWYDEESDKLSIKKFY